MRMALKPYDPAARREYYLKNRVLKGRRAGSSEPTPSIRRAGVASNPAPRRAGQAKARQQEIARQREALNKRLERLKEVLSQLLKEAQARAGVTPDKGSTPAKSSGADKGSKSKSDRKLTAKQKRDAAKRSKEYREEHKDPSVKDLQADIAEVREKIKQARADLQAAIDRARQGKPKASAVRRSTTQQSRNMTATNGR